MAKTPENSPTISGHLGTIGVQDVMGFLATAHQGGALEVESPDGALTLFLEGNAVVGGQMERGGVDTAAFLLGRGRLSSDDLEAVRREIRHGDFYSALAAAGRRDEAAIAELVAEELSENLLRLFTWAPGDFRFFEGRTPPPEVRRVSIGIQAVLLEAARRCGDWSALPKIFAEPETRFELRAEPREDANIALGLDEWKLLYRVANRRRLAEIWEGSPLGSRFATSRMLFGLASARLIHPIGAAKPASGGRPPTRSCAEIAPPVLRPPVVGRPDAAGASAADEPKDDTQPVATPGEKRASACAAGRLRRSQIRIERTPRLVHLAGDGDGPVFPLAGEPVTLGRSADNQLVLPDSHVSGRHARIVRDGDRFEIEDTHSSNGIRVNGRRALRASLEGGEEIEIYPYRFRFEISFEIRESG